LEGDDSRWKPRAEALLFAAARSDHVEKTIKPALDRGEWVLSDRFLDSSLAYQGEAGALGLDAVRDLHRFGSLDFLPDRTLVLVLDESEGALRARARDGHLGDGGRVEGDPQPERRPVGRERAPECSTGRWLPWRGRPDGGRI